MSPSASPAPLPKHRRPFAKVGLVLALLAITLTACTDTISPSPLSNLVQNISTAFQLSSRLLPAAHGLPDTLAGYNVLAVQTSETTACIPPGEVRVELQTLAPDVQSFLASNTGTDALQALRQINPNTNWGLEYDGPGIHFEEVVAGISDWNRMMAVSGCVPLGGPFPTAIPGDLTGHSSP